MLITDWKVITTIEKELSSYSKEELIEMVIRLYQEVEELKNPWVEIPTQTLGWKKDCRRVHTHINANWWFGFTLK